jgi:hypothetical protein
MSHPGPVSGYSAEIMCSALGGAALVPALLVASPGGHQQLFAMPGVQDRPRHLRSFLRIGRVNCVTLVQHSVQYCAAERATYLAEGHLLLIQKGLHHAQFPETTFLPLW